MPKYIQAMVNMRTLSRT